MSNSYIFAPPQDKLKLTAYVFKYPKQFWKQAIGGIIYNVVVVSGSIFMGKTIDAANSVYKGEAPLSFFYLNLLAFIGFTIIFQIARYFKRYYNRELANLMKCDIRAGLLSVLFQMPAAELSHEKVGDMMSRMIGDVEQVAESVRKTMTEMWDTAVLMIAYFTVCLLYSPKITLLAAIPIPFAMLIAEFLRHKLYSLSQKARKTASKINVHLQHNVSGIALFRLFGLEETDRQKFSGLLDEQLKWNIAAAALQNGMLPLYILIACSGIILVVGMGGEYVVAGRWTIGTFTAFLSIFTAMAVRTNVAAKVMNTWHGAKASWDRICEKLSRSGIVSPDDSVNENTTAKLTVAPDAALEVRSLSFTYPFGGKPCVEGISFTAKKGEIIGVTGPVGSGKSALAAALSGLYPYQGEMHANGKVTFMDSEHFVFSDSLKFNVTFDRNGGDMTDALSLAELKHDIDGFESGIDTKLMERGVRISGGQRQRVSLARAWYSGAEILILDDPFSAIDVNMEQRIMSNIRSHLGSRTVILFSHRLSTFDITDKILVIEKGRISQAGTHDELLSEPGLYKEVFMAQRFMRGDGND